MTLRGFYRFSATCLTFALFSIFIESIGYRFFGWPAPERLPLAVVFLMGSLGALSAILFIPFWVGMIWHCLLLSGLPLSARALWLVLMVPTLYIGILIYYYAVFCRTERGL